MLTSSTMSPYILVFVPQCATPFFIVITLFVILAYSTFCHNICLLLFCLSQYLDACTLFLSHFSTSLSDCEQNWMKYLIFLLGANLLQCFRAQRGRLLAKHRNEHFE